MGKTKGKKELGDFGANGKIIDLAQDRNRWWALVGVVINLRTP
jgi:hypothetical protein